MPFVVIRGTYHVKNYEPDGDSIRFQPDNPDDWARIRGRRRPRVNARDQAQLRIEAIDALETHFSAGGIVRTVHQPLALADGARDRLLALLKITDVRLARDRSHITAASDGTEGYILTRDTDPYGRPIAFVFAGDPPLGDPSDFFLTPDLLQESVNYQLAAEGLVYPTYYTGLFTELRAEITTAVDAAREAGLGVWADDATRGAIINSLEDLTANLAILPKLFRRLTNYVAANGGDVDLSGFKVWLAARHDRVFVLGEGHETGLDNLIDVAGQKVSLTRDPNDLVFVPG